MQTIRLEKSLYWIVRIGAYMLPFTLFIVADSLFFPFVTGKNFLFRIIVEIMTAGWIGLLIVDFSAKGGSVSDGKKYWPQWNFISIAFSAFVGIVFLTAITGVDFQNSFWSNFERMDGVVTQLHLLALFFVLIGTFRVRREWFSLFGVSIVASVLVAFYGLLESTGEIVSVADSARIISTLGNPLYVAAYLSFNIFLAAFLWFRTESVFLKWTLGGVALFEVIIFFLTGARGAFVGMLAGLGVIFLLLFFFTKDIKKKLILGGVIVVLLLVPVVLHTARNTSFIQSHNVLSRFANITLQHGQARMVLWGIAFEAFKEKPILGWGIGNFDVPFAKHYDPHMYEQEPWFDRTHNMPLEWLVSGGIVLFGAYLTFLLSMVWGLMRGAKNALLEKRDAFILLGMFVAYLVQLLFVFDTLATYLMSVIMLGFLFAVSSPPEDRWLEKNSLSRVLKIEKKNYHLLKSSLFRVAGIVGVFSVAALLVAAINVRPILAAQSLIKGLGIFGPERAVQTKEYYENALLLSRFTVGASEAREHLAINVFKFSSDPQQLQKPEVGELYRFAVEEMEKQINQESKKNISIRQHILLAQLYGMLGTFGGSREAFEHSASQYEQVITFAPRYVHTYPVFANMLARTGNLGKAIDVIAKAETLLVDVGKYDPQIFYSKPLFYTANRQYDEAYDALQKLSMRAGAEGHLDAEMLENIVQATRSHEPQEIIPFLEKVYGIDKTIFYVPLMLAQLYAVSENPEQARFHVSKALELNPSIEEQVAQFLKALDDRFGEEK